MKKLIFFASLLGALFIFSACEAGKPMSPEEKQKQARIEQCANKAKDACNLTAKEACKSKSSFAKIACENAAKEACMQTAKEACK